MEAPLDGKGRLGLFYIAMNRWLISGFIAGWNILEDIEAEFVSNCDEAKDSCSFCRNLEQLRDMVDTYRRDDWRSVFPNNPVG